MSPEQVGKLNPKNTKKYHMKQCEKGIHEWGHVSGHKSKCLWCSLLYV
jgi:hypothetical protein